MWVGLHIQVVWIKDHPDFKELESIPDYFSHTYVIDHTGIIIYSGHPLEQNFEIAIAYVIQEYKKAIR